MNKPNAAELFAQNTKEKFKGKRKTLIWGGSALILIVGFLSWWFLRADDAPQYLTQEVTKGELSVSVTATGTVQPTNTVDISSELSGTVHQVLVDYNDVITKGQVLATLDTTKLKDQIAQAKANLQGSQARVLQSSADVSQAQNDLARLQEVAKLSDGRLPSKSELDTARLKLQNAQAALASAKASVAQYAAALKAQETDLTKTSIRSPINGVVLTRSIEPGQTVASSLQAPVLFNIAEDLTQMELNVAVAEADVGQIKVAQNAKFSVDAYPEKSYQAKVKQVRYGSKTVDNVVSYETILNVDNTDLTLRPGMTATADILVAERKNTLLIPATALRYKPQTQTAGKKNSSVLGSMMPQPMRRGSTKQVTTSGGPQTDGKSQEIWVLRNNVATPVTVVTGLSDGRNVEVKSGDLKPKDLVIVGLQGSKK